MLDLTETLWQREVVGSARPVPMRFWARWNGPSRALLPVLRALADHFAGKVTVARVNADEDPDLAARYQIISVPCTLLFHGGDRVVARLPGLVAEAQLLQLAYRALES